jgi:DNA-binding response OmpR family regulator
MARILLVDDDKDICTLGTRLLNEAGHEAFSTEGVFGALEFLRTHSVDLVITDANMPQHSGFDLIKTLKNDSRWANLSFVMLTGRRERKDIERALLLGAHDYIVKPLDPMLFLQKINDLVDRRPPEERPFVDFAAAITGNRAKAIHDIELIKLSELGLVFRSSQNFSIGARIEIASDVFEKIGIAPPLLRVQHSTQSPSPRPDSKETSQWETRVVFVGADEKTLSKIRKWVFANSTRNVKVAG